MKMPKLSEPKAIILGALIAAFATIFIGILSFMKEEESVNKDNTLCDAYKNEISKDIHILDNELKIISDDEKKFTFLFWKKSLEEVLKYDCEEVENNIDKINDVLKQAAKETGI